MLIFAKNMERAVRVARTRASVIDTLTGIVGELVFSEWFTNDWRNNEVGRNMGVPDFRGIVEIKTSSFPFRDTLNLLVREDYAQTKSPDLYVQIILDVPDSRATELISGTSAYISGWATDQDVKAAPLRDFGSKFGGAGGYRCRFIKIRDLCPMSSFAAAYAAASQKRPQ